jgi:hypothetical protein
LFFPDSPLASSAARLEANGLVVASTAHLQAWDRDANGGWRARQTQQRRGTVVAQIAGGVAVGNHGGPGELAIFGTDFSSELFAKYIPPPDWTPLTQLVDLSNDEMVLVGGLDRRGVVWWFTRPRRAGANWTVNQVSADAIGIASIRVGDEWVLAVAKSGRLDLIWFEGAGVGLAERNVSCVFSGDWIGGPEPELFACVGNGLEVFTVSNNPRGIQRTVSVPNLIPPNAVLSSGMIGPANFDRRADMLLLDRAGHLYLYPHGDGLQPRRLDTPFPVRTMQALNVAGQDLDVALFGRGRRWMSRWQAQRPPRAIGQHVVPLMPDEAMVGVGDVTGNGRVDVVTTQSGMPGSVVRRSSADALFDQVVELAPGTIATLGDLNRDGRPDPISYHRGSLRSHVLDMTWDQAVMLPTLRQLLAGDWQGNGHLNLIGRAQDRVYHLDTVRGEPVFEAQESVTFDAQVDDVVLADQIDVDEGLELYVRAAQDLYRFTQVQFTRLSQGEQLPLGMEVTAERVWSGSIQGTQQLFEARPVADGIQLWHQNASIGEPFADELLDLVVADVDADGQSDVLVLLDGEAGRRARAYGRDLAGTWRITHEAIVSDRTVKLDVGDVDGDGLIEQLLFERAP